MKVDRRMWGEPAGGVRVSGNKFRCTCVVVVSIFFFFSSRRRHTRLQGDWSSDVCSSDLSPRRRGMARLAGSDLHRRRGDDRHAPPRAPDAAVSRAARAAEVAAAAQLACLLEASAPKPGNVSPGAAFRDATYEDFLASAVAIGPALAAAGQQPLGATIRAAVEATARWAPSNTK